MRIVAGLSLILCCGLAAQTSPSDPLTSLAEAARKAREKQASQPKATKTFDNDSMKSAANGTPALSVVEKPSTSKSSAPNAAALEKTYRAKFSQLRNSLKAAQAEDQRLQAELSRVGPNSAAVLHPYYDPRTIQRLQSQIDTNNRKITTLKTQLDDLTEELRKGGLPPRWAEP
jgi:predicted RNase H-like nuclease (RuvC/YqgF family)